MNEQAIRKIVDDEIKKKLFQLPKIPPHKHDGTDNINIPATSVTPPIRAMATRVRFNENQNYTFYFPSISPQMVLFEGYALQNTSVTKFTMTSSLSAGANFGTLTSTWGGSTENLLVTFSSGETRVVSFTSGSLTIFWTPPLNFSAGTTAEYATAAAYALINGNAIISPAYQFQAATSSSVVVGGLEYPISTITPQAINQIGVLAQSSANTYLDPTNVANMTAHLDANFIVNVYSNTNGNVATAQLFSVNQGSVVLQVTNLNGWHILGNLTFI
jgi:hypothetical protein